MAARKIDCLQVGRAFAAIAVVLGHAALAANAFGSSYSAYSPIFQKGFLGVDFFFVLSGFIIFTAHSGDSRGFRSAVSYARKRLIRIFVPYLPVCLIVICAYVVWPNLSAERRSWSLFTSLLLLPSGSPPALSVAWTLVHEMCFYIVFLVYFVGLRIFRVTIIVWVLMIVCDAVFAPNGMPTPLTTLLSPMNLEFVAGMLAASAVSRLCWRPILFILAGVIIAAGAQLALQSEIARLGFGLGVAVILVGAVRFEQLSNVHAPASMLFLGEASYAIYLIHSPFISLVARAVGRFGWWQCFVACSVSAVLLGAAYHYWYERPALAMAARVLRRQSRSKDNEANASISRLKVDIDQRA